MKRREKMNNKGFSLVELIIVIAIMAILAAALAPQLMKYIEKSRVSTDTSTCESIKSAVNAALAEEVVYKEVANAGTTTFTITDASTYDRNCPNELKKELQATMPDLKAPKANGVSKYQVVIAVDSATKQVGKVTVTTIA